ncbi:MAG TPA: porin family protein [Bacteroidales bacterium]|nr:porin family protein [Bacteroidales bacterium]
MKRNRILLLILLVPAFFFSGRVHAQHIYGALSAGINVSQVDGDEVAGYKHVGFNGGPSVIIPFTKNRKWTVTMELLFSQKGSYEKRADVDTVPHPYYKLNLDYVEVPVLVHFTDKNIVAGGLGFSYGQLVGVKEWQHGSRVDSTTLQGPYALPDLSVVADVRLRLWQRLWLDVRFTYSILKIRTRYFDNVYQSWTRDQYNNVLSFRLTYIFNEPLPAKKEKTKK